MALKNMILSAIVRKVVIPLILEGLRPGQTPAPDRMTRQELARLLRANGNNLKKIR